MAQQARGVLIARDVRTLNKRDERERRWFDAQTAAELVDEPELSDLIAALPERLDLSKAERPRKAAGGRR